MLRNHDKNGIFKLETSTEKAYVATKENVSDNLAPQTWPLKF